MVAQATVRAPQEEGRGDQRFFTASDDPGAAAYRVPSDGPIYNIQGGGDQALGWSRGGFSTKIHVRADGYGKPVTFVLTGGERHEQTALPALLDGGAVKRPARGRPRLRPARLAGDKGYSSPSVRQALRRRGIRPVIPTKSNQRRCPGFDRAAYRERNRVERLINRLKQCRAIATRYDKLAVRHQTQLTLPAILIWL